MMPVDGEHALIEDVPLFFFRELARRRVVAHLAVSLDGSLAVEGDEWMRKLPSAEARHRSPPDLSPSFPASR
jgi:hypothetical protein